MSQLHIHVQINMKLCKFIMNKFIYLFPSPSLDLGKKLTTTNLEQIILGYDKEVTFHIPDYSMLRPRKSPILCVKPFIKP
jgi:hypothetical protein